MNNSHDKAADGGSFLGRPEERHRGRSALAVGSAATLVTGSVALISGVLVAAPAGAATFTVTQATDDGTGTVAGTLSHALAQANLDAAGDTIEFSPSLTTITFSGDASQIVVTEPVNIVGPGADLLTIDLDENCGFEFVGIEGVSSVSGLTFVNGSVSGGCNGDDSGGAIFLEGAGSFSISDAVFRYNYAAYYGGAVACMGGYTDLTVERTLFVDNAAEGSGGALYFDCQGTVAIIDSTFLDNSSAEAGGGAGISTPDGIPSTIVRTSFLGNVAGNGGGADFENGLPTILDSTFYGNSASGNGGGLAGDVPITIVQTTISGNTSLYGSGGGVSWRVGGFGGDIYTTFDISMSTISGNSALYGASELYVDRINGSGDFSPNNPTISGSIVAGEGDSVVTSAATVIEADSSIFGATSGVTFTDNGDNQFDVSDPGLEPLADNGGPTLTMALSDTSPAIDAGPATVPDYPGNEWDQRGEPYVRVYNGRADVGAFEAQPDPDPTPPGPQPDPEPDPDNPVTPSFAG